MGLGVGQGRWAELRQPCLRRWDQVWECSGEAEVVVRLGKVAIGLELGVMSCGVGLG